MTTAVEFLWRAAGCPDPITTDGIPIPKRDMKGAHCAATGLAADYRLDDAISDNFTTMKNAGRAWPFGGNALSSAAVWCARSLALRCALFFAREEGFWFESIRPLPDAPQSRRPDPLATLLNPPEPPFVAGLPLYGIDHGGEANAERAIWWMREAGGTKTIVPTGPWVRRTPSGEGRIISEPLTKLQSKHTALYCRIARSRDVYPLQVDDSTDVTVDVLLWSQLRDVASDLLSDLRASGVGAQAARTALLTGRPPIGASLKLMATWADGAKHLRPALGTPWWRLFVGLLPMPNLSH